jgi:hypothetical protein
MHQHSPTTPSSPASAGASSEVDDLQHIYSGELQRQRLAIVATGQGRRLGREWL